VSNVLRLIHIFWESAVWRDATDLLQHGKQKGGGSRSGRPWLENGVRSHRRRICKSNTVFQINIMSNGF
jgi:hypothetical protein